MKATILVLPALLALAACDGGTQGAGVTDEETATSERAVAAGALSLEEIQTTDTQTAAGTQIPASIQGRWGLVPADCESGRADAKGLLTITGDKLEFYVSVGTLAAVESAGGSRIRAAFDFTGEGMTWKRDIVLDVEDQGAALIRHEYGEGAAPGQFRYAKCS